MHINYTFCLVTILRRGANNIRVYLTKQQQKYRQSGPKGRTVNYLFGVDMNQLFKFTPKQPSLSGKSSLIYSFLFFLFLYTFLENTVYLSSNNVSFFFLIFIKSEVKCFLLILQRSNFQQLSWSHFYFRFIEKMFKNITLVCIM